MNKPVKAITLGLSALCMMAADFTPEAPFGLGIVREAEALIGRPLTPLSFAGVARRTTRRAVYYGGVAAASAAAETSYQQQATAEQQAATAQQQAATAQQQAAQAAGAPAIGTVVGTLPTGCAPATISGVEYHHCNGVYYRAAFQGNNLVYVVTQPK
jgi:hypothetical protein